MTYIATVYFRITNRITSSPHALDLSGKSEKIFDPIVDRLYIGVLNALSQGVDMGRKTRGVGCITAWPAQASDKVLPDRFAAASVSIGLISDV